MLLIAHLCSLLKWEKEYLKEISEEMSSSENGSKKPWFYTVRKHKKKCIFFTAVGLWGVNFAVKQFRLVASSMIWL
jgi:hypothetical protein